MIRLEKMTRVGGEVVAYRWYILSTPWFKVYVHKFVANDMHFHDHPKRFVTIGLWGEYGEVQPGEWPGDITYRVYRAPWIRTFPATHVHRIVLSGDKKPCWTLAFVGQKTKEWGFL